MMIISGVNNKSGVKDLERSWIHIKMSQMFVVNNFSCFQ
jgi:hypothetical protein